MKDLLKNWFDFHTKSLAFTSLQVVKSTLSVDPEKTINQMRANIWIDLTGRDFCKPVAHTFF